MVRIKAPLDGATVIRDAVQGDVTIRNDQLDDMVLLRSDGTPVYMLAVVVDDHDMGVTHAIRGDDHLNNAARQMMIYQAMGWDVPVWAHIPLIHGPDGKKLSKRHGALGVEEYQAMGYPAAGMRKLSGAAGLEPWRRRVLYRRPGHRVVRPRRDRQIPRPVRFQKAGKISAASISPSPTMLRCCKKCRPISP